MQEEIRLAKSIPAQVAIDLAERLEVNPVTAVIHQYRRIGGDNTELTQVLSDMKLSTQWVTFLQHFSAILYVICL